MIISEDWYVTSHRLPLIIEARRRGYDVTVLTHVDAHAGEIEAAGARVVPIDMDRSSFDPRSEARVIWQLVRALRRLRPAVVHNVALKPIIYGTAACRLARVPAVVNAVAGLGALFTSEPRRASNRAIERVLALALRDKAAQVLVQNEDDRAVVVGLGARPERVEVIRGSGVDIDLFRPSPPPAEPPIRVLYVGRLLEDKGVRELHDAARTLRADGSQVVIDIVGDRDPHNPACLSEAELERWRAEGVVTLLGRRTDIPDLMAGAHVVVLPSYREGLPKSLLEAAASGRPMIATDVPGCREVVRPGVTGLLVPARDPAQLAEAIAVLARDAERREQMGKAARALAETEFADTHIASRTVDLWESLGS